jgi:hypothetical protein
MSKLCVCVLGTREQPVCVPPFFVPVPRSLLHVCHLSNVPKSIQNQRSDAEKQGVAAGTTGDHGHALCALRVAPSRVPLAASSVRCLAWLLCSSLSSLSRRPTARWPPASRTRRNPHPGHAICKYADTGCREPTKGGGWPDRRAPCPSTNLLSKRTARSTTRTSPGPTRKGSSNERRNLTCSRGHGARAVAPALPVLPLVAAEAVAVGRPCAGLPAGRRAASAPAVEKARRLLR